MITIEHLTKVFGAVTAVNDLTVEIQPGKVTGFLGPNGAGKTTTLRCILGLDHPTKGTTKINGQTYAHLPYPLREVGALLDAKTVHPSRSARNHLRALAASNDIPAKRADEVLEQVGLSRVATKRAGTFSLGMGQRLGIAAALLGDPPVLMFDEPINGLDPEGIRWVRELFHALAAEGRTVLVSSHLMSEMSLTAEDIIVIGRGQLIRQGTIDELTETAGGDVRVRTPDATRFAAVLRASGATVTEGEDGLTVRQLTSEQIGDLAFKAGVTLHELTPQRASLEDVFMELTAESVEYAGHLPPSARSAP